MSRNTTNYPAVVIPAFNRPKSFLRLLRSLEIGNYPINNSIELIISIDGGGDYEVLQIAKEFNWKFGTKTIIEHRENLGLKNHIIYCGDLTEKYGSIILLEDDLVASRDYYIYAYKALEFFSDEINVGQISLYAYDRLEDSLMRFYPLKGDSDCYFIQWASSWGQAWSMDQWKEFKNWYKKNENKKSIFAALPSFIKSWGEHSWKKFFISYLVSSNKYTVFPYHSLTSPSGAAGVNHNEYSLPMHQSSLCTGVNRQYNFKKFQASFLKYDVYFEPEKALIDGITQKFINYNFECDFYGTKNFEKIESEYLFSIRNCTNPIHSFDCKVFPLELNLLLGSGSKISFGKKCDFNKRFTMREKLASYLFLQKLFNPIEAIFYNSLKILYKLLGKL